MSPNPLRADGRRPDELRSVRMTPDYLKDPEGSVLIEYGRTWVVCTASVEARVPPWLKDSGGGWVTAEYAMLPRSTTTRSGRQSGGRAKEIERLIGRSLRASIDLVALGARSITVDCDVLQADGGTRTAAITGGYVALALAVRRLVTAGQLVRDPLHDHVAAVSVGIVDGTPVLDLDYLEDVRAGVDMNVVMTGAGRFVELQGTAEHTTFDRGEMLALTDLAHGGITLLVEEQRRALAAARV